MSRMILLAVSPLLVVVAASPRVADDKTSSPTPEQRAAVKAAVEKLGGRFYDHKIGLRDRTLPLIQPDARANRETLKKLPDVPFPFTLYLQYTAVTDDALAEVKNIKNLVLLDLCYLPGVTDAGIKEVSNCSSLEGLFISSKKITDESCQHLKKMERLVELNLLSAAITEKGLLELGEKTNWEYLAVGPMKLGDGGMKAFRKMTKLKYLILWGAEISDTGLAELREAKDLQELYLMDVPVSDKMMDEIQKHTSLRVLEINRGQELTDAGAAKLKSLTKLQKLRLGFNRIGDQGIRELKPLKELTSLDLGMSRISDAAIDDLASFKNLQFVSVFGTGVSDEGAKKLRKALPKCHVKRTPFD